jgi:hypothetical protein
MLLIVGFVTFVPTIGHGGGEFQLLAMASGAVVLLLTCAAFIVIFVASYVKRRR